MREPQQWRAIDTDQEPLVVVGARGRGRRLQAWAVDARTNAQGILRDVAERAVTRLAESQPVPWEPEAGIEDDEEYLVLDAPDLLAAAAEGNATPGLDEASQLLSLLLHLPALDDLDADRLAEGSFLFYAI